MLKKITFTLTLFYLFFPNFTLAHCGPIIIPNYSEQKYKKEIIKIYNQFLSNEMDINTRVDKISHYFLNKSYILGALGEGRSGRFDQSPFYRTDAFDCATYVSTVISLAKANDLTSFEETLKKIQYRNGQIAYTHRYHFIELDWNHQNQRMGYLKDITQTICKHCHKARVVIDKPTWFQHANFNRIKLIYPVSSSLAQHLLSELHQKRTLELPAISVVAYIPLTELFWVDQEHQKIFARKEIFARIPTASVIEIVDSNKHLKTKIGTDLNVVHMGFAIRNKNTLLFRHASTVHRKTLEVPLSQYLFRYYIQSNCPKAVGINVQKVL